MELRIYLQMLQRSWWVVLLTALSALVIALAAVFYATPIYRASARFVVSPDLTVFGDDDTDVLRSLEALDKRSIIATYAEVLNSERVFQSTVDRLGISPAEVENYTHTTVVLPDANILELSVEGPNPEKATSIANTLSQVAIEYISQLYSVYEVSFLDSAKIPERPIRPQPVRDASLAFALGLVMGAVLAIVREQLRTPLETFLQRSMVDNVSMAYNRRYFVDNLDEIVSRSDDKLVALGLVRLDNLENYLDVLPQPIIQKLLRQVTEVMRQELRGNDIVGRWDENTISILLPDTPGKAAHRTLGRVQEALREPMRISPDGERIELDPYIGIGERLKGDGAGLVIERAEAALEEAQHDETGLVLHKTRPLVGF